MKKKSYVIKMVSLIILIILLSPLVSSIDSLVSIHNTQNNATHIKKQYTSRFLPDMILKVDECKVFDYVYRISNYGPRPTGSKTLDEVLSYIFTTFEKMNVTVTYDYWENDGFSGKNIIATLPGISEDMIIVTAHADTIAVSPGADDDASGIAAILTLAEIMKDFQFNATVKFIIFTGEEDGCFGSLSYAQKAYSQNQRIIGVLSLDKIGYALTKDDGNKIRHHANTQSVWMIDYSDEVSKKYKKLIDLEVVKLPYDASSDHRAFVQYGYAGSNFVEEALSPVYHTSEDTIHYINKTYLGKVTRLALGTITEMTQNIPLISQDDITISITGSIQSIPSRLSILVENKKNLIDSANVTITISLTHLFRDSYVVSKKQYYTEPCIWNFTKEIKENWEFKIGPRVFSQGLFCIDVIIYGINDDKGFSAVESRNGLLLRPNYMFLLPW